MKTLSKRQTQVIQFISDYLDKWGQVPSYRVIGKYLGVAVNAVSGHIEALERKGLLTRDDEGIRLHRLAMSIAQASSRLMQETGASGVRVVGNVDALKTWPRGKRHELGK